MAMIKQLPILAGLCLVASTVAQDAAAHHSFSAQYDGARHVSLTGVVVKIEWLNPHAYFYMDVTDEETGEVVTWATEMTSPVALMRRGWSRDSMKIGDVVVVEGNLARDGSPSLNAQSVVLTSTGQRLFTRSPSEESAAENARD